MRSILAATIGLSVLAFVSAASARENAARLGCPSGYAVLGAICISASSGDIVLPTSKKTDASAQARAGR